MSYMFCQRIMWTMWTAMYKISYSSFMQRHKGLGGLEKDIPILHCQGKWFGWQCSCPPKYDSWLQCMQNYVWCQKSMTVFYGRAVWHLSKNSRNIPFLHKHSSLPQIIVHACSVYIPPVNLWILYENQGECSSYRSFIRRSRSLYIYTV